MPLSKEIFQREITLLAVSLGTTIDPARMLSYYDDLGSMSDAEFSYACQWLRKNFVPTRNLFPVVKEFMDAGKAMPRIPAGNRLPEVIDFEERKRQHQEGAAMLRASLAKLNEKYGTNIEPGGG